MKSMVSMYWVTLVAGKLHASDTLVDKSILCTINILISKNMYSYSYFLIFHGIINK